MKKWTISDIAAVTGGIVSLGSLIAGLVVLPSQLAEAKERQTKLEITHGMDMKDVNSRVDKDASRIQDVRETCIRIEESNKAILDKISDLRRYLPRASVGNKSGADFAAGDGNNPQ